MKRIIASLAILAILAVQASAITIALTQDQYDTMMRALKLYNAMHSGKFEIVQTGKTNNNIYREIRANGQAFRFVDTLAPIETKIQRHFIGISYGSGFGLTYGFSVFSWLSIIADADTLDGGHLRGGIGFMF